MQTDFESNKVKYSNVISPTSSWSAADSGYTDSDLEHYSEQTGNQRRASDDNLRLFENPLSDPIVRSSLERLNMTSWQLINMTVKELNKRLAHCEAQTITKLKRCRRTLKNRGYAKNCRIKRIAVKNQLERINVRLTIENKELKARNKGLVDQLAQLLQNQRSELVEQSLVRQQLVQPVTTTTIESARQNVQQQCQHQIAFNPLQPTLPEQHLFAQAPIDDYEFEQLEPELGYGYNVERLAEQLAMDSCN